MELEQLIDALLSRGIAPEPAPTESEYHALWLRREVGDENEFTTAALGGALADRLAWVFVAGYQATIRRCFPGLPRESGWCAFVNTEDSSGAFPGTTLAGESGQRRLSGWKGWVAAADHIDRLLVSASHNQTPFLVIRRDQPGVTIETGAPKGYLSEMVQGRAHFADVAIAEEQVIGDERTFPVFRSAESAYVRVALAAFILGHSRRLDAPPSLIGGAVGALFSLEAILRLRLPSDTAAVGLLGAANQVSTLAAEFEALIQDRDRALHALWIKDRRLVGGALPGIAARAAKALGVTDPEG